MWAVVPDSADKQNFQPTFCFSNMPDVIKMKAITQRTFVAPIMSV